MPLRVKVVFHVAGFRGIDGVVSSHIAVLTGEPFCASLAEDDVAGDDVLIAGLFGSQASTCGVVGTVCSSLRGV